MSQALSVGALQADVRKIAILALGVGAVSYLQDVSSQGKSVFSGDMEDIQKAAMHGLTAGLILWALEQTIPRAAGAAELGLGAATGLGLL